MNQNKNIDQMCEELLEGIRRTSPELYDALVDLGTLNSIVQAMEEKENLVEDHGQCLEQYIDDVVAAAKETYGAASVVVVDDEGNVLRDTRDEDWDSDEDEDWDSDEDEDWDSDEDEDWDSDEDDEEYDWETDWITPVAVFSTHSPDGESTRAEFYTESAMVAYMENTSET